MDGICNVNLSTLSPEDVHCAVCVQIYVFLMHTSSLLNTIVFMFTAYTVLTRSTALMAMYRVYLLNCLCWGYLYALVTGQNQLVTFSPVDASYLRGMLLPA